MSCVQITACAGILLIITESAIMILAEMNWPEAFVVIVFIIIIGWSIK